MLLVHIRHLAAAQPRPNPLRKRMARQLRPVRPSRRNELWYRSELGRIVGLLRQAGAEVGEGLRWSWPRPVSRDATSVADETDRSLSSLLSRAAAKFGRIGDVAQRLANLAARKNLGEVDDRLAAEIKRSVGVDLRATIKADERIGPAVHQAIEANVELIKSIPAQYFDHLHKEIDRAWQDGIRWESLAERIAHVGDVTESRIKLIARDQTAKLNSDFNRIRQQSVGIARYIWSTSRDERVRRSHAFLNGKTFRWDQPPEVDGEPAHPGKPINCRCVPLPVFDLDEITTGGQEAIAA